MWLALIQRTVHKWCHLCGKPADLIHHNSARRRSYPGVPQVSPVVQKCPDWASRFSMPNLGIRNIQKPSMESKFLSRGRFVCTNVRPSTVSPTQRCRRAADDAATGIAQCCVAQSPIGGQGTRTQLEKTDQDMLYNLSLSLSIYIYIYQHWFVFRTLCRFFDSR